MFLLKNWKQYLSEGSLLTIVSILCCKLVLLIDIFVKKNKINERRWKQIIQENLDAHIKGQVSMESLICILLFSIWMSKSYKQLKCVVGSF